MYLPMLSISSLLCPKDLSNFPHLFEVSVSKFFLHQKKIKVHRWPNIGSDSSNRLRILR